MEPAWIQAIEHIRKAQELAGAGPITRALNIALASLSYVVPDAIEFDRLCKLSCDDLHAEVEKQLVTTLEGQGSRGADRAGEVRGEADENSM